jgi:hypothetical protein
MNAFTWLLQGLHESRRRSAAREIRRHAHLLAEAQESSRLREIQAAGREEDASWRDTITAVVGAGA